METKRQVLSTLEDSTRPCSLLNLRLPKTQRLPEVQGQALPASFRRRSAARACASGWGLGER